MGRLRFGIRTKVLLMLSVLLLVLFSFFAFFFVQNTIRSQRQNLVNEAKSFATLATDPIGKTFNLYQDSGTIKIAQQIDKYTELDKNITNVAVIDLTGKVEFSQSDNMAPHVSEAQASSFDPVYISGKNGFVETVVYPYIEDSGIHRYAVVYSISSESINRTVRQGIEAIIIFAVIALILTIPTLYFTINYFFLSPIARMSHSALAISTGQLEKEIPEERQDEIGDLAQSVNTMADSLKADIAKLKEVDKLKTEFMMIASHNLRTPLTVINGYLETIKTMGLPDKTKRLVETAAANSARLTNLAEDILTIAELDAGHKLTGETELVELGPLVDEIVGAASNLAQERGVTISYQKPTEVTSVPAVRNHLKIAIWNLVDNAIKFTKPSGKVNLEVSINNGQAQIVVSDNGIGIPPEEMSQLFTKFHRGTSTFKYDYEGTGIGLYISRLLVQQFGGNITVNSQPGKGSTFAIILPMS